MKTDTIKNDDVRKQVSERYAGIAEGQQHSCCGSAPQIAHSKCDTLGYNADEVDKLPDGADMGLGCGNPHALASIQAGETVLDLGSGGGIDCFIAAKQVGSSGSVIGVDMTPEMIRKARKNASDGEYINVDFRLGEIEHLPVADDSVDIILSNCVVNLSPDKQQVFNESYRVLKEGGRLAIADIVATAEMPQSIRDDLALYTGCIAGAALVSDLEQMLSNAGFKEINIKQRENTRAMLNEWSKSSKAGDFAVSAFIEARK